MSEPCGGIASARPRGRGLDARHAKGLTRDIIRPKQQVENGEVALFVHDPRRRKTSRGLARPLLHPQMENGERWPSPPSSPHKRKTSRGLARPLVRPRRWRTVRWDEKAVPPSLRSTVWSAVGRAPCEVALSVQDLRRRKTSRGLARPLLHPQMENGERSIGGSKVTALARGAASVPCTAYVHSPRRTTPQPQSAFL